MAINFTVSPSSGFAMATEYTFTDTSVLPNTTIYRNWSFDDTTFASGLSSVIHTFEFPKTYEVTLNLIDNTGTSYSLSTSLEIPSYLKEAIKFVDPGLFVVEKGQTQRVPLRIELSAIDLADCSPQQNTRDPDEPLCGHYINLYSQYSQSTPLVPSLTANRWSALEPYWRFLDLDMNPVDTIKSTDTVIYFEGSAVGVTGYAEFYYVDDSASPEPLILWATLQTSAINFNMDRELGDYPSFANSKVTAAIPYYVDGVDPSYLKIGEDVTRDIYPIKWQNSTIPHLITIRGRAVSKLDTEDAGESLVFDAAPSRSVFSTASGAQGFSVLSQISGCEPDTYTFDTTGLKIRDGYLRGNVTTTCTTTGAAIKVNSVIAYEGYPRVTPYTWVGNPKNISITQYHFPAKIPEDYPETVIRPTSSVNVMEVSAVNTQFGSGSASASFSILPSLFFVSTSSAAVTAEAFAGIYGFAVDPAYNVWVTDADLDIIYKIDADRNIQNVIQLQTGTTPASICLDGDLNVYAGLHDGAAVVKLDKNGEFIRYVTLPPFTSLSATTVFSETRKLSGAYSMVEEGPSRVVTAKPIAVETDSNNNLWAIFGGATYNALIQFTPEGEYAQHINFEAPYQPVDLIVDTWDNDALWVSTPIAWGYGGEIRKYTTTGRLVSAIKSFYQPNTLAQDLSGNIWCTYGYDRVGKYDIRTHQTTTWIISAALDVPPAPPPPPEPPPSFIVAPVFNPPGGLFGQRTLRVIINSATQGAYISYTTDGSTPTSTHGTIVPTNIVAIIIHGPITLPLKAMAFWPGVPGLDSLVTSATYTLYDPDPLPAPVFDPEGGNFEGESLMVVVFCSDEDAHLSWTIDGSDPSSTHGYRISHNIAAVRLRTVRNQPITINLKAMAFIPDDFTRDSAITSDFYTLDGVPQGPPPPPPPSQLDPPTVEPVSGHYDDHRLLVTINSTESGAYLCYTEDGSTPTQTHGYIIPHSRFYTGIRGPVELDFKAIAFMPGVPGSDSTVVTRHYIIDGRPRGFPEGPGVEEIISYSDFLTTILMPAPGPVPPVPPGPPPIIGHPTPEGENLWFNPNENPDFSRLQGIACDSQNRIWTIDSEDNKVYIIGSPETIPGAIRPPPDPRPPPGNLPVPSFDPEGGTYNVDTLFVQMSSSYVGTYLSYTTDGSTPSRIHGYIIPRRSAGLRLRGPVTTTVKAMDFLPNDVNSNSSVSTETYILEGDVHNDGPGIDNEKSIFLPFNFGTLDRAIQVPEDVKFQPPGANGYAITSFKILPDANMEVYDDTLDDTSYLASSAIFESAQSFGDWTGYKWHQKYSGYQIGRTRFRSISGVSAWFDIYGFVDPFDIRKFNESFDVVSYMKSLPMPDILAQKHVLFDKFFEYAIGGLETNDQSVARIAHERIGNFVPNHSDIETCGIFQLYSLAEAMDVSLDDYNLAYPPEMRRLLDLLSISHTKLWGARSKNAKAFKDDFSCCLDCKPVNKGELLSFTDYVTAGTPVVAKDFYSETYMLVPVFPLSGIDSDDVYQLAELENPELQTPLSSWYVFYTYIPTYDNIQVEGVINWDDPYTTLEESNSSVADWIGEVNMYGDNGIVETIFNYQLHRGLGLIDEE